MSQSPICSPVCSISRCPGHNPGAWRTNGRRCCVGCVDAHSRPQLPGLADPRPPYLGDGAMTDVDQTALEDSEHWEASLGQLDLSGALCSRCWMHWSRVEWSAPSARSAHCGWCPLRPLDGSTAVRCAGRAPRPGCGRGPSPLGWGSTWALSSESLACPVPCAGESWGESGEGRECKGRETWLKWV